MNSIEDRLVADAAQVRRDDPSAPPLDSCLDRAIGASRRGSAQRWLAVAAVLIATIVLIAPDGAIRQVAEDIAFANGMAVTPDNKALIVAESHASRLTAFDIAADGGLANRRVWADLDGFPDGICLDAEGAAWYADVPNKHCVRVREGGEVLQIVTVDRGCFACMLGGTDRQTLFIVAAEWRGFEHMISDARTGQVLSTDAPAPGVGWPG